MPDGSALAQIKISQLPVGSAANLTDQLEANQAGVSASITVAQVATTVAGTLPTPPTIPTTLPPSGPAAGDLAGSYPGPTIKLSVGLTGSPTAPTPTPSTDNSTKIATTAFVQSALSGVSVTIPAGTVAFGGAGGALTGNSTLAWDNTNKALAITSYTGAVAGFSLAGSVPATAVDAFLMSISNPSGNTGNIFRLRAGAAGTTDQFKVDMTGDAACGGSVQALSNSAPPAGGNGAFGIFLGNFSGGNSGLYFGSGAPTFSTFGRYGSLYINTATPGIPYFNNNGTTGWDQLVGLAATQTLTNKTITGYATTASIPTTLPPNGAAGGALNGTYPNPGIAPSGTNGFVLTTVGGVATWAAGGSGKLLQTVNIETGAMATGTTVVPVDDTIPQITEGDQYMTLAITPQSATSKLIIDVTAFASNNNSTIIIMALFQDATANALAVQAMHQFTANNSVNLKLTHIMTSGTTSATTFRVRIGGGAGTTTFNGLASARYFGGALASSIVITEELP